MVGGWSMVGGRLVGGFKETPISLISSKGDEERVMHSKVITKNSRFMITQMKSLKNFLNHFLMDIKRDWKHQ